MFLCGKEPCQPSSAVIWLQAVVVTGRFSWLFLHWENTSTVIKKPGCPDACLIFFNNNRCESQEWPSQTAAKARRLQSEDSLAETNIFKALWGEKNFQTVMVPRSLLMRIDAGIVIGVRGSEGSGPCLDLCCYLWMAQQVAGDPHGHGDAAAATENFAWLIGFRTGRGNWFPRFKGGRREICENKCSSFRQTEKKRFSLNSDTMNINHISLSRMSTIFYLLIPISSLRGPFISSGRPLKGRSSLPPLISSQPHRSQAFPTQCSLYSHKDPRNPAACPQLIFPVAILLTQPPTGRWCKWGARNRPLCVPTPTPPHRPAAEWPECQSPAGGGGLTHRPLSASRAFQTQASPPVHPSNDQTERPLPVQPTVVLLSSFFSTFICFYLSNLSFTLIRTHKDLKLPF